LQKTDSGGKFGIKVRLFLDVLNSPGHYQPPTQKEIGALAGIRIHTRVGRALKDPSPAGKHLSLLWEAAQTPEGVMEFKQPRG